MTEVEMEFPDLPNESQDLGLKKLWVAVIHRAALDYVLYVKAVDEEGQEAFESVNSWLFKDNREIQTHRGVTFPMVCALLGIEPDYVRRQVIQMELQWRFHPT